MIVKVTSKKTRPLNLRKTTGKGCDSCKYVIIDHEDYEHFCSKHNYDLTTAVIQWADCEHEQYFIVCNDHDR